MLAEEWKPLTAGSEGFLSGGRRGLEGQKVVWGEQDGFVGSRLPLGNYMAPPLGGWDAEDKREERAIHD